MAEEGEEKKKKKKGKRKLRELPAMDHSSVVAPVTADNGLEIEAAPPAARKKTVSHSSKGGWGSAMFIISKFPSFTLEEQRVSW